MSAVDRILQDARERTTAARLEATRPPPASEPVAFGDGRRLQRMRVKTVGDDWLICRTWDGSREGAADVKVAKPYKLRRGPFHGLTIAGLTYTYQDPQRRTVTNAAGSETQVIVPTYQAPSGTYPGDEIMALWRPRGGTGVAADETPVAWLDLNVDARAWAEATS